MSGIIFEAFVLAEDVTAQVLADAPRATARFTPWAEGLFFAASPLATLEFSGRPVGMAQPSASTIYGSAPMADAFFECGASAFVEATAPTAGALFSGVGGSVILASPPRSVARLSDTDSNGGYIAAYYLENPYVQAWAGSYFAAMTSAMDMSDSQRIAGYLIRLRDTLRLQDTQRSILSAAMAMEDPLYLRDTLQVVYLIVMQDVMELDGSLTATRRYLQRLVDTLLLEGVVDTELDAAVLLASTLLLTDAGQASWFVGLQSVLEVGDDVELSVRMVAKLIDQLLVDDQLDMTLTMHAYLSDSLPMSDDFGSQLDARVVLQSALEMFGRLTINGDTWACYVMNTESKGIVRFTNYPFNSFAKLPNGQWIGATDTGLHLIGGDTDAGEPITARIRSALTDFGSRHMKRVPNMYIGYTADGQVGLKVVHTSERGDKTEDHYLLEPRDASDVRESRYKIGRGIASVFLGFELVNIGGADFALDVVEWLPMRLDRRVR